MMKYMIKMSQILGILRGEIALSELVESPDDLAYQLERDLEESPELSVSDLLKGLTWILEESPDELPFWVAAIVRIQGTPYYPLRFLMIKEKVKDVDLLADAFSRVEIIENFYWRKRYMKGLLGNFSDIFSEEENADEDSDLEESESEKKPGQDSKGFESTDEEKDYDDSEVSEDPADSNDVDSNDVDSNDVDSNDVDSNDVDSIIARKVQELREVLERWVLSEGTEYPDTIRLKMADQFDCDTIDLESEATQQLFKECLDYCCDVLKEPTAIQRRGYCYYCGTKIYPNDWVKARDAFLTYYEMTGDASAANTLGYIYYYGRCNQGEPQYEEAFKYFSIGHAFTYFESSYKLADMLAHGYGVVKNGSTANHIYWTVYTQNLERFLKGDFSSKFADAALRMGNCYLQEIGVDKDLKMAYYYYLQADYAIRRRVRAVSYYGDSTVYNGIQNALAEVREEYTECRRSVKDWKPFFLEWALKDHRPCKMTIKEKKKGRLELTITPMKWREEEHVPLMLVTIPEADYCELKRKIRIKTAKGSKYKTITGKPEVIFDSYEQNWDSGKVTFYRGCEKVGQINTEEYCFKAPKKPEVPQYGEKYHFVGIRFKENGHTYDYLCNDQSIKAGDRVIVPGYDGETEVEAVRTFDLFESELGLPLERYKRILRKAEEQSEEI